MTRTRLGTLAFLALATALLAAAALAARERHDDDSVADVIAPSPNIETDSRSGEPPLPLTPGEQEKFAAARAAIAAAEAAGTRWVEPFEMPPVTFGRDAEAAKQARLRAQAPDDSPGRPGIAAGEARGAP